MKDKFDEKLLKSLLALPFTEVENLLQKQSISYVLEYTKPCKSFFPLDEKNLYVLRCTKDISSQGIKLTLASKQKRRCAEDGI